MYQKKWKIKNGLKLAIEQMIHLTANPDEPFSFRFATAEINLSYAANYIASNLNISNEDQKAIDVYINSQRISLEKFRDGEISVQGLAAFYAIALKKSLQIIQNNINNDIKLS